MGIVWVVEIGALIGVDLLPLENRLGRQHLSIALVQLGPFLLLFWGLIAEGVIMIVVCLVLVAVLTTTTTRFLIPLLVRLVLARTASSRSQSIDIR